MDIPNRYVRAVALIVLMLLLAALVCRAWMVGAL